MSSIGIVSGAVPGVMRGVGVTSIASTGAIGVAAIPLSIPGAMFVTGMGVAANGTKVGVSVGAAVGIGVSGRTGNGV